MAGKSAGCEIGGDKNRAKLNSDDGEGSPFLPESLVMHDILPRLPVKSLIRFQLVSKNWLDYISTNPNFAKLHIKLSSLLRPQFFIMNYDRFYKKKSPYLLSDHQECSNNIELEYALGYIPSHEADYTHIVDSCNGLVCLYHSREERGKRRFCFFGIWNPATRKCRGIDSPPGVHISMAYGFGYVSSLDDYKIVASFATETKDMVVVTRGFYVFSLKSGKWEKIFGSYDYSLADGKWRWRRIRSDSDEDPKKRQLVHNLQGGGLGYEGIIYWPPTMWSLQKNIVGFDLRNDEFIECGSIDWKSGYRLVELFRLKGSLALHACKRRDIGNETVFWTLKDVGDWDSWQKLFSVNLTQIPLITLSENGKCLARQSKQLKLVDLSKEALESCKVGGRFKGMWRAVDLVESLVSPFGMIKSEEEEQNLQAATQPVPDTLPL